MIDEIPAEFVEIAAEKREELLEAASDFSEELMMAVLEGEEVDVETLKGALRAGVLAGQINPVFVGAFDARPSSATRYLLKAVRYN